MNETEAEQFIEDLLAGARYRNMHMKNKHGNNNSKQAVIERDIRKIYKSMFTYTYAYEQK
jgi:hypothetical protein